MSHLKENIKNIIYDYEILKLSQVKLAEKYSTSHYTIRKLLVDNGVKIRLPKGYSVDTEYFKEINTEKKAYFLGLLLADGSISKIRKEYNFLGRVKISLQERDSYILDELKEDAKYSGPIYFIKRNKPRQNQRCLSIASKKFCKWLYEAGMNSNKTYTNKFPKLIPDELLRHFIRGFFDGDGGATYSYSGKYVKYHVQMVGSKPFMKKLYNEIVKITQENVGVIDIKCNDGTLQRISISNQYGIKDFYDFLYKDANIFLKRKKKKIEEILNLKITKKRRFLAISPNGEKYISKNQAKFERDHSLKRGIITNILNNFIKNNNTRWTFKFLD